MGTDRTEPPDPDDSVPIFGSWPRIYAAVVATAVAVIILIAFFTTRDW